MQKIKKFIKPALFLLVLFIIYFSILTLLHYTGFLKLASISKVNFTVISIVTLLIGIITGKKTSKKGYLEGLKQGSIIIAILFILNLICYRVFNLYLFVYYLLILVSTTIGSMIGINLKH